MAERIISSVLTQLNIPHHYHNYCVTFNFNANTDELLLDFHCLNDGLNDDIKLAIYKPNIVNYIDQKKKIISIQINDFTMRKRIIACNTLVHHFQRKSSK